MHFKNENCCSALELYTLTQDMVALLDFLKIFCHREIKRVDNFAATFIKEYRCSLEDLKVDTKREDRNKVTGQEESRPSGGLKSKALKIGKLFFQCFLIFFFFNHSVSFHLLLVILGFLACISLTDHC